MSTIVEKATEKTSTWTMDPAHSRKDYGLTWNVGLETGGVLVGDEVKIWLEVEAVKQG